MSVTNIADPAQLTRDADGIGPAKPN